MGHRPGRRQATAWPTPLTRARDGMRVLRSQRQRERHREATRAGPPSKCELCMVEAQNQAPCFAVCKLCDESSDRSDGPRVGTRPTRPRALPGRVSSTSSEARGPPPSYGRTRPDKYVPRTKRAVTRPWDPQRAEGEPGAVRPAQLHTPFMIVQPLRADLQQVRPVEEFVTVPDTAGDVEMVPRYASSSAAAIGQEVCPARPLGRRPRQQLDEHACPARTGRREEQSCASLDVDGQPTRQSERDEQHHGAAAGPAVWSGCACTGVSFELQRGVFAHTELVDQSRGAACRGRYSTNSRGREVSYSHRRSRPTTTAPLTRRRRSDLWPCHVPVPVPVPAPALRDDV